MAVDGHTAEAVHALRAAGVEAVLLKGPAIARWLYDERESRPYSDADLLVAPETLTRAESVLVGIGYELRDPEGEARLVSGPHAQTWLRADDGATVDLHRTLPGEVLAETVVWPTLWARRAILRIAGTDVPILDEAARALMVAVHAAHHGTAHQWPLEDLRRAIAQVPEHTWDEAVRIAEQIMALPQLARGLRLLVEGAALAERLGLPDTQLLESVGDDALALGIARMSSMRGMRPRAAFAWRRAFPGSAFMHWWKPWSQRSRAHLAAAHGYRLGWLLLRAGPALAARRRRRGTSA